jgi:hypothetical protein
MTTPRRAGRAPATPATRGGARAFGIAPWRWREDAQSDVRTAGARRRRPFGSSGRAPAAGARVQRGIWRKRWMSGVELVDGLERRASWTVTWQLDRPCYCYLDTNARQYKHDYANRHFQLQV